MHLVRAVRHLGMSLDLRDAKVPSFADAIAINQRVRALTEAVYGADEPTRLRYVDKVLMELSLRGMIGAPQPSASGAPIWSAELSKSMLYG